MSRRIAALLTLLTTVSLAHAEQKQLIGDYEAHYSVVPTTFLRPEIAAGYGITRSRDRALVNVAIVHPERGPVRARVSGSVKDLLSQVQPLVFEEIVEAEAVYYLTTLRHDDRETLRFTIDVEAPDGSRHEVSFQQMLYWEDR